MTATSTKTRPPTKGALAQLEDLELTLVLKTEAARELRQRHYAKQEQWAGLHAELELAESKAKADEAERIRKVIADFGQRNFEDEIAEAEGEQRAAEAALAEFRLDRAKDIAAEIKAEGEIVAKELSAELAVAAAKCDAYVAITQRLEQFCGSLPGSISGQDVSSDSRVSDLRLALTRIGDITGPWSWSLAPLEPHYVPRYKLSPDARGWIRNR